MPVLLARVVTGLALAGALMILAPRVARAQCTSPAAGALRADARQATLWNWGWGGLFAASIVAHASLAHITDDDDARVALWTGAAKSAIGTVNQILRPIRIHEPKGSCQALGPSLVQAAEVERRKRNWFAHLSVVGVNAAAFAFVQYRTSDLRLSITGAVLGSLVGELTIFSAPTRVRSGGFALESVRLAPSFDSQSTSLAIGASF